MWASEAKKKKWERAHFDRKNHLFDQPVLEKAALIWCPPPPPSLGIAPARSALANAVFSRAVSMRFPSGFSQGAWDCLEQWLHPKTKKGSEGEYHPPASVSLLQGSCRMLGPATSCLWVCVGCGGGSCLVGCLRFWSVLFSWVTSTSSKDMFDETC